VSPDGRSVARVALALLGVACLAVASFGSVSAVSAAARAWLLTAGFASIALALYLPPRRALAPLLIALVFVVYGGLSALVAIPQSAKEQGQGAKVLTPEQVKAAIPSAAYDTDITDQGFKDAALITSAAGLAAIAAAFAFGGEREARRRRIEIGRVEYAGKALVVAGFAGVIAALIRFCLTQLPTNDLFQSFKSMWTGGSYFLLVAAFAVPGFGLWLTGLLERRSERSEYVFWAVVAAIYLALLVPTGQRGFAVALALLVLVILTYRGRLSRRAFAGLVVAGIVLIGLSQAARNELRETKSLSPSDYLHRIEPSQWRDLYGSQLASFNWTVIVHENADKLDIPNSFPRVLLKPIPRQIYPSKSQGFGQEFTSRVYPGAAAQNISFSVPLTAESDYDWGFAGMVVVFLVLGALAGLAERRIASRAPPLVVPIVLATIAWCVFCLVRGDLANAVVVSAGWVIPLLFFSRSIGLRRQPTPRRLLVDALQAAPEFSGIGRRIQEIGQSLSADDPGVPVTVRCAADVRAQLEPAFPPGTTFETPLSSSRPRLRRILYQQLIAPLRDDAATLLLCPGDQAPVWGRAPLVFVIHDVRRITAPQTAGGRAEAIYYWIVIRAGTRRAMRVLTISEFTRQEILRVLRPSCPVEVLAAHPAPREEALEEREGGAFLAVGALRPYKGLDTVVEALAHRASNGAAPTVICVGSEEAQRGEADRLARQASERGVGDRFRIAGWVSDEKLEELLAACVATVSASHYEGYGLPVAESLAAGLPTIASDIPAHREVAAEAALYFPPGDAKALASAMSRVAEEPELRRELARSARERARELANAQGSWGETVRRVIAELSASEGEPAAGMERAAAPATSH
jgi:glycosyltransferase involved in cell wall biosynthesis